jgi:heme/copper-type cytochrome/quinol oxidase subunit 3
MSTISYQRSAAKIPSGALGMSIFVMSEIMLFMGFISAFNVVKAGAINWPPPNQPRLPVEMTAINTLILCCSGVLLYFAYQKFKAQKPFEKLFLASIILGLTFILIQGYEWTKLISYGLTLTSSNYGGFFYLIVGAHALHAFAAILLMLKVYFSRSNTQKLRSGLLTIQVFWYFVVGMWPLLYITVYL